MAAASVRVPHHGPLRLIRVLSLQVWDYRGTSDAPLYTIQAHTRDIINMDVHENAFASGSLDDSLKMWLIG
jgi:hypothetical protein